MKCENWSFVQQIDTESVKMENNNRNALENGVKKGSVGEVVLHRVNIR